MPHGAAAREKNYKAQSKARVAAKKAARRAAKEQTTQGSMHTPPVIKKEPLAIPTITEDDLLAFHSAHFGDAIRPENFFVEPEVALNFDLQADDGLGWYEDGTKRTLTDEDIAWFKKQEIIHLLAQREKDDPNEQHEPDDENFTARAESPVSEASSMEADLVGLVKKLPARKPPKIKTQQSQGSPSQSPSQHSAPTQKTKKKKKKKRKIDIPYHQRNKRKWENYIDGEDPNHGSMTHRRMAREMDKQRTKPVAMDYGEEAPATSKPKPPPPPPGRRIISYEDD